MISPARTTVDAVAAALESVDPAWLHARAARFDEADEHIANIADGFRSVLRDVVEVWQRYEAGGAPPVLGERSLQALRRLAEMRSQPAGAALRRAADSLAQARLELRSLRATGGADAGGAAAAEERAIAVLNRVSQDFAEAGHQLLALPYGPPAAEVATRAAAVARSVVDSSTLDSARASTMELTAADDVNSVSARDLGSGLGSTVPLSALPDASNQPAATPMMPMMPMGMGAMGSMPQAGRDRLGAAQGAADPGAWREPDDGWETVGRAARRAKDSAHRELQERAEREIERMIDDLREGRNPTMGRRGR